MKIKVLQLKSEECRKVKLGRVYSYGLVGWWLLRMKYVTYCFRDHVVTVAMVS